MPLRALVAGKGGHCYGHVSPVCRIRLKAGYSVDRNGGIVLSPARPDVAWIHCAAMGRT